MPNWCENIITAPARVLALLRNDRGHADFEMLLPTPGDETVLREAYDNRFTKLFESEVLPPPSFSASEGVYWWRILNWGTKWNIDTEMHKIDDSTQFHFDTAWSPARGIAKELSRRSPGIEVMIEYFEPGNWFAGWDVYVNGDHSADVEVYLDTWEGVKWARERFDPEFGFCSVCEKDLYVDGKYIEHEHNG